MTPQSEFMVLAAIEPAHEVQLRALLESMNDAPGQVNPDNALLPFARFDKLHFSRFLILDDKTTGDVSTYGLATRSYPLYLAFLGDIDGSADAFFRELVQIADEGLRAIYSCCHGFAPDTDLVRWMKQHETPAIANYVNWRGRTVQRVREEAALRDAIESHLQRNAATFRELPPRKLHHALREFTDSERNAGRLTLSKDSPTPIGWKLKNLLHLVTFPLLAVVALPLMIVLAPLYLWQLRQLEKTDPELCPRVDQTHSDGLASREDHYVTNQFTAMGSLKPGVVRLVTVIGVLTLVDWAARHLYPWPTRPYPHDPLCALGLPGWAQANGLLQ